MELTRRDALAALAATGVAVGGGATLLQDDASKRTAGTEDTPLDRATLETYVAAAHVLYPSEVSEIETFVTQFITGRAADDADYAAGITDTATYLDNYANAWYDRDFTALDTDERDKALHRMGADVADPDPTGADDERVRYYVVNELLFALYTSPTGAELAGLENPPGHPGGTTSYQQGLEP